MKISFFKKNLYTYIYTYIHIHKIAFSQSVGMTPSTPPFITFFCSVDGLLGMDTKETLKRVLICLVEKCQKNYYRSCKYIKSRVVIMMVQVNYLYIQVSQAPVRMIIFQR